MVVMVNVRPVALALVTGIAALSARTGVTITSTIAHVPPTPVPVRLSLTGGAATLVMVTLIVARTSTTPITAVTAITVGVKGVFLAARRSVTISIARVARVALVITAVKPVSTFAAAACRPAQAVAMTWCTRIVLLLVAVVLATRVLCGKGYARR